MHAAQHPACQTCIPTEHFLNHHRQLTNVLPDSRNSHSAKKKARLRYRARATFRARNGRVATLRSSFRNPHSPSTILHSYARILYPVSCVHCSDCDDKSDIDPFILLSKPARLQSKHCFLNSEGRSRVTKCRKGRDRGRHVWFSPIRWEG